MLVVVLWNSIQTENTSIVPEETHRVVLLQSLPIYMPQKPENFIKSALSLSLYFWDREYREKLSNLGLPLGWTIHTHVLRIHLLAEDSYLHVLFTHISLRTMHSTTY